jgi:DNA processing protein
MEPIVKLTVDDPRYPERLKELHDPPDALYLRGNAELLKLPAIAMVGTRRASTNGLAVARNYAHTFASHGIAVVSGLAIGIDAASHTGAIDANGPTIAVLGSGVDDDSLYPRANLGLARRLLSAGGLILSENPPGTHPQNFHFPMRNRVIAALSRATVVVEAPLKSGALITAKYALEIGRDVYAVPADVTRESAYGSNKLIAFGAPPLLDPNELVETITGETGFDANAARPQNPNEQILLSVLTAAPMHVDDLTAASKLTTATVQATLTALELRGAIVSHGNMCFSTRR